MIRKKIGALLSIVSVILLLTQISLNITGNVISENSVNSPYLFIIAIIFLSMSFVLLITRRSIDAIIIPTGSGEIERAKKAAGKKEELKEGGYFVISGYVPTNKNGSRKYGGSEVYDIYKELRAQGISPSHIQIEPQARNTIENVVYSLQKIKKHGGKDVGIVSYPGHLNRFETIIRRAKREGIIDKDFRIYRIETKETHRQRVYEVFEKVINMYRLRHGVKEAMKHSNTPLAELVRKVRDYFVDRI